MGHLAAAHMAETNGVNKATILWHLTSNHYPPFPAYMAQVALEAIEGANRGEWGQHIELPSGTEYRGRSLVTVGEMVEAMHLEAFLGGEAWE